MEKIKHELRLTLLMLHGSMGCPTENQLSHIISRNETLEVLHSDLGDARRVQILLPFQMKTNLFVLDGSIRCDLLSHRVFPPVLRAWSNTLASTAPITY